MGAMQDKEFDKLFKDQLENAEVTPSAGLWDHIAAELEPKAKKRRLPVFWMSAAAVVVVALMIGLLMPKTAPIRLQGIQDLSAVNDTETGVSLSDHTGSANAGPSVNAGSSEAAGAVTKFANQHENETYHSTPLIIAPRLTENEKKGLMVMQPKPQIPRHVDKEIREIPEEMIAGQKTEEPANEVMIAAVDVSKQQQPTEEEDVTSNRGIRNVGDLVNYVVDKVDRRERKFLKFNTDDDDNSSLVAINIGFIKLNSRKHK